MQNWLPVQGCCLAKRGSQEEKRGMLSHLGIQSHMASVGCRRENVVIKPTADGHHNKTKSVNGVWGHHGKRQVCGCCRFKKDRPREPRAVSDLFPTHQRQYLFGNIWDLSCDQRWFLDTQTHVEIYREEGTSLRCKDCPVQLSAALQITKCSSFLKELGLIFLQDHRKFIKYFWSEGQKGSACKNRYDHNKAVAKVKGESHARWKNKGSLTGALLTKQGDNVSPSPWDLLSRKFFVFSQWPTGDSGVFAADQLLSAMSWLLGAELPYPISGVWQVVSGARGDATAVCPCTVPERIQAVFTTTAFCVGDIWRDTSCVDMWMGPEGRWLGASSDPWKQKCLQCFYSLGFLVPSVCCCSSITCRLRNTASDASLFLPHIKGGPWQSWTARDLLGEGLGRGELIF